MVYNPFKSKLEKPSSFQGFYDYRSYKEVLEDEEPKTTPVGYPSYYGKKGRTGGGSKPSPYAGSGYGGPAFQDPKLGWTSEDWAAYAADPSLNPPKPTRGVFFNPNIPRSNVFERDDENRIIFDEQGRPIYKSTAFTDYLDAEGVKIAWPGGVGSGNVPRPGRWTDWILGKLGYGYGDRGIDPYRGAQTQQAPPQQQAGGYYGGGGYGRGGGGGGGGYSPGSYSSPTYSGGTRPYQSYAGYAPENDWFVNMVKWRIGSA